MVTHTSRHILDLLKQTLEVIIDARERLKDRLLPSGVANVIARSEDQFLGS